MSDYLDDPEKFLDEAKERFRLARDAESEQRQRELEDLKFQVPEMQWPEAARRERSGGPGLTGPERPILSIPKLDQPLSLIENQMRAARLGVEIFPMSPDSNDDTAEVLRGLYRKIEQDSNANNVRYWAFSRALRAGRGAYRVCTYYDDAGGHPFDQCIKLQRILYQDCVYFDPAAQECDWSDGRYAFVLRWMPLDEYRRLYPESKIATNTGPFDDLFRDAPNWVNQEGGTQAVLIAEYWCKKVDMIPLRLAADGTTYKGDERVPRGTEIIAEREIEETKVYVSTVSAVDILEPPAEWNGRYIPLIPVIGRELQPFDSQRWWVGLIGPNKDAQRMYNYAASAAVEAVALEPKAPYHVTPKQIDGFRNWWDNANTRNFPYLPHNPDPAEPGPPQRSQIDGSKLQLNMGLLAAADNWLQSGTAMFDPSLGRTASGNQKLSGRAIGALQEQGNSATSDWLQNLADVSMMYEAKVILDLIPRIYDRPGRIARTLDMEDRPGTVMLNAPFVMHPESKRPLPVGPNGEMPQGLPPEMHPSVKHYDLTKGTYAVTVSIGRAKSSLRAEALDSVGQILQARPELFPILGPTFVKYQDWPGSREMAKDLLKLRDQQFPGIFNDDEEGPSVEQLKGQIVQMQEQIQMGMQMIQQLQQLADKERMQAQTTLQKAQMDNDTKLRVASLDAQTKLAMQAQKDDQATADRRQDAVDSSMQRLHEKDLQRHESAHDVALENEKARLAPIDLNFKGPNETPMETSE